jgi:probable HAF family extracellular repeat protein
VIVLAAALPLLGVAGAPAAPASARPGSPTGAVGIVADGTAYDVNEHGVVVGYYYRDGEQRAFRWRRGGPLVDLGPGIAYAVNDAGTVVGQSHVQEGGQAVRWTRRGTVEVLAPDAVASEARDIDRHGTIVGAMNLADGSSRAFVLPAGATEPQALPLPPGHEGDSAAALALNDRGTIVGPLQVLDGGSTSSLGLVWRGRHHQVAILPGTAESATVTGINDRGTIIGATLDLDTGLGYVALRWTDPTRPPREIGVPGTGSVPHGINERGVVVGTQFNQAIPFQWDPRTGRTTTLTGIDPDHGEAYAINDHNLVVGYSISTDSPLTHATLFARP